MTERQENNPHIKRRLVEPCPFCGRRAAADLWFDPGEWDTPYQVRCEVCGARGPECDCGEESAVVMWLSIDPPRSGRGEWQPIETAPRDDGKEFLAWCFERPPFSQQPERFLDFVRWTGGDPRTAYFASRSGAIPTHWTALPEPPSALPITEPAKAEEKT